MRISSSIRLVVAAIILDGSLVDAPTAAAAQVKPLIKVVAGYGSTDGAIAPLWFAKETGLFEKRGLDTRLVPWLQDFSLGRTYTLADVQDQIEAARDAGAEGYLLWNAAGLYTRGALADR